MRFWKRAGLVFALGTAVCTILKINFFTPHDRWDEALHSHVLYGRYPDWMSESIGQWTSSALDTVALAGFLSIVLLLIHLALTLVNRESWRSFLVSALAYTVSLFCSAAYVIFALGGLR